MNQIRMKQNIQINWESNQKFIRVPITVIDKETNEPTEILMRMVMNIVTLEGYGKTWTFSKSSKGKTVLDSRDNKRKETYYIWKELVRLLGEFEGEKAYEKLTTV
jgi:hypothetical protein